MLLHDTLSTSYIIYHHSE